MTTNTPRTVVLAFDGVFRRLDVHYGERDGNPKAIEFAADLLDAGWDVVVYDYHSGTRAGRDEMRRYIEGLAEEATYVSLRAMRLRQVPGQLRYTQHLPRYHAMINPRAVQYWARFPTVDDVANFKPWSEMNFRQMAAMMRRLKREG